MQRVARIAAHVCSGGPTTGPSPSSSAHNQASTDCQRGELVVTIIGAGNSGHVCASLFHGNSGGRVRTQLLTSKPEVWKCQRPVVHMPHGGMQRGYIHKVSADPADLIPGSDIVLWTGPVTASRSAFESIQPYVDTSRTAVGTIFSQGLTHLLARQVFGPNVRFFALRNIPWLCRVVKPGEECEIVGAKSTIGAMTINLDEQWMKSQLEPLFYVQREGMREPVVEMLPDFCPIVFNPANQIIHPASYWAHFRNWRGKPLQGREAPNQWLYRDMDEVAGRVLEELDEELQQLKDAYHQATGAAGCESVVPLKVRLLEQYGDQIEDKSSLARMVGTNKAYQMAKTPVIRVEEGVMPNPTHRVVTDDIGWGLCALVSVAERLAEEGIESPTTRMREMIEWHQRLMGKEFLRNGRLLGKDCEGLALLRSGDSLELVAL